jgi:hypothetical protein
MMFKFDYCRQEENQQEQGGCDTVKFSDHKVVRQVMFLCPIIL